MFIWVSYSPARAAAATAGAPLWHHAAPSPRYPHYSHLHTKPSQVRSPLEELDQDETTPVHLA